MRWLRTTWLILLTLAAATLPANVRSLPVAAKGTATKEANADQPSPSQRQDEKNDSPGALQIALEADVWDGSSVRASSAGSGPLPASALETPAGLPIISGNLSLFARIAARISDEQSQRRWLVCRYAHAPPVGA